MTTLADLTNTSQLKSIHLNYLDGTRPSVWKHSNKWPRQHEPSKQQKRLWKRYIRSSFLRFVPYLKLIPLCTPPPSETILSKTGPTSYSDFSSYLRSLPWRHRQLLDLLEQVATDLQVWRAFRSRSRLHVASDGGLHRRHGMDGLYP